MRMGLTKTKYSLTRIILVLVLLVVISAVVTYCFVGNRLISDFGKYYDGIIYGFFVGLTFWLGNRAIGYYNATKINWRKNPNRANLFSILLFIVFGIIASISVPLLYHLTIHRYTGNVINTIVINSFINLCVDMIFISIFYSKYLARRYAQSLLNEEELKRENLVTKYEALKSQVNPHFLFNSLNTLTGIVEKNPEKASEFIKKLSDIYRYVLEQLDKEVVSLDDELKFVENYIHLAKIRHGEGLKIKIAIQERNYFIAPLALQILVENAIKHNIVSDDMPLDIEIGENKDFLIVKNNVQKKTSGIKNNSLGLENLRNRYRYLSDLPVMVIGSDNLFIVKLPLIKSREQ